MERYTQRESVHLGYNLGASNPSFSPKSQCRSSDVDFNDVFGGPPRRSSLQEGRSSFLETASGSDDDAVSNGRRWSGLSEKPVFGDEGVNRRQDTSNDFFDDIFGGNESVSSSPRKNGRDSFPFMSSSRVFSPARSQRIEPFGSPAQFSLPAKLVKGTDLPTFGSTTRYHYKSKDGGLSVSYCAASPLARSSSQRKQAQEELRSDAYYGQSSLWPGISRSNSSEELLNLTKTAETEIGSSLKGCSNASEVLPNGGKFHFSIYKWASEGVVVPLRGGNKSKLQRCSSVNREMVCEDIARGSNTAASNDAAVPSSISRMPSDDLPLTMELNKEDLICETSMQDRVEHCQAAEEETGTKCDSQTPVTLQGHGEDALGNPIFQNSSQEIKSIPDMGLSGKTDERVSAVSQGASKDEIKSLRSLLFKKDDEQDVDETARTNGLKDINVKGTKKPSAVIDVTEKVKKKEGKKTTLNSEGGAKTNSPTSTKETPGKSKVRGRVKDFVKIFNQEPTDRPKPNVESQTQNSESKERSKIRKREEERSTTTMKNEQKNSSDGNWIDTPDDSTMEDEHSKQSEIKHPEVRTKNQKSMDHLSSEFMDSSTSTAVGSEANVEDADDYSQGYFMVTELLHDEGKPPENGDISREEIQVIDAKIWKWSNGKEGNIRSLLSTLQYVLWPGSGWKSVPLVVIIEGNAVKRSYQTALLCLHPDKLQQKGATSDQKYLSEKVFDILQEAWDQFNVARIFL